MVPPYYSLGTPAVVEARPPPAPTTTAGAYHADQHPSDWSVCRRETVCDDKTRCWEKKMSEFFRFKK